MTTRTVILSVALLTTLGALLADETANRYCTLEFDATAWQKQNPAFNAKRSNVTAYVASSLGEPYAQWVGIMSNAAVEAIANTQEYFTVTLDNWRGGPPQSRGQNGKGYGLTDSGIKQKFAAMGVTPQFTAMGVTPLARVTWTGEKKIERLRCAQTKGQ